MIDFDKMDEILKRTFSKEVAVNPFLKELARPRVLITDKWGDEVKVKRDKGEKVEIRYGAKK